MTTPGTGPSDKGPGTSSSDQGYDLRESARKTASGIADHAQEAGRRVGETVSGEARSAAESAREHAAGRLDHVASALDASARELRGQEDWLARLMGEAARYVGNASEHLDRQDVQGLVHEVSGYARRHPAIFLGAAAAAGFAIGRLAKASRQREGEDDGAGQGDGGIGSAGADYSRGMANSTASHSYNPTGGQK